MGTYSGGVDPDLVGLEAELAALAAGRPPARRRFVATEIGAVSEADVVASNYTPSLLDFAFFWYFLFLFFSFRFFTFLFFSFLFVSFRFVSFRSFLFFFSFLFLFLFFFFFSFLFFFFSFSFFSFSLSFSPFLLFSFFVF